MKEPIIYINQQQQYLLNNTLFVFALESEADNLFTHCNCVFIGVGKINAAYRLTKAIAIHKPQLIINLGSAGSNFFQQGQVVCCNRFIQRDMDVRGLGFALYETPFSNNPSLLEYGLSFENLPTGTCGTGDSFEMNHTVADYNLVDMEAFPLAWIAHQENIPFLCLKYISDGADGAAADDWTVQVHKAAAAYNKLLFP